jgi:hypothetical protein
MDADKADAGLIDSPYRRAAPGRYARRARHIINYGRRKGKIIGGRVMHRNQQSESARSIFPLWVQTPRARRPRPERV